MEGEQSTENTAYPHTLSVRQLVFDPNLINLPSLGPCLSPGNKSHWTRVRYLSAPLNALSFAPVWKYVCVCQHVSVSVWIHGCSCAFYIHNFSSDAASNLQINYTILGEYTNLEYFLTTVYPSIPRVCLPCLDEKLVSAAPGGFTAWVMVLGMKSHFYSCPLLL